MSKINTALLLVAHGSRRAQSNEEVKELANSIANSDESNYALVHAAFLEIAEPTIPQGLQYCIEQGVNEILVFPYFLSAGRHVVEDIPNEIATFRQKNPQISIQIADYLGYLKTMPQTILAMAKENN